MNITERFAREILDDLLGIGTFGQDIFVGGAPLSAPDAAWWVVSGGGAKESDLQTGESLKRYQIDVYYRSTSEADVYNLLQTLEEDVNSNACTQLTGYDTIDMEATLFPVDQDLDAEDRKVGLLQVNVKTHKE